MAFISLYHYFYWFKTFTNNYEQFTNFIENNISQFDSRWKNSENISFCETDVLYFRSIAAEMNRAVAWLNVTLATKSRKSHD